MRILSTRAPRGAALLLLLAALIAGCVAPAEHPVLDQAGAALERARSAPRVRALAPAELDLAEMALEHARAAAEAGAPPDQVEHLAYVVNQRAALAEKRAAERVARSEIDGLERALDEVLAHGRSSQGRHTRAPLHDDQRRRTLGSVRPERDRQEVASPAQRDQWHGAPLEEAQKEHASLDQDQQEDALLDQDQQEAAPPEEDQQEPAPSEEDQQERLSARDGQREWALVRQHQQEPAPLGQAQQKRAPAQEDQQDRAPLAQGRQGAGSAAPREQQVRAIPEQERKDGTSVDEGQRAPGTEPDVLAAIAEPVPEDISLSLSQLPFEGAEPTSDALEQLAALAERLAREPGPSVVIEADFDLPDPEARTVMERRVEVVRALLVERGIAAARLVVRASGDGPKAPQAAPSLVEPADRAP